MIANDRITVMGQLQKSKVNATSIMRALVFKKISLASLSTDFRINVTKYDFHVIRMCIRVCPFKFTIECIFKCSRLILRKRIKGRDRAEKLCLYELQ